MRVKTILLVSFLFTYSLISSSTEYYTSTTVLNVRYGEGKEYPVSFTLQQGQEVEIISKNGSWFRIKHHEQTGYAHSKYLKYSRTVSDITYEPQRQSIPYLLVAACVIVALFFSIFFLKKRRDIKLLKTVTETKRGLESERDLVLKLLKFGLPAHTIFHDLYLEKQKDDFSQIDLVAITEVGVIVFEVKEYSGWLFGNGNQSQWTQVLAYGKQKYRFYNPIMQNSKHITELRRKLVQFGNLPFYSILVFYGDCVLKEINYVPNGTFLVKSERVLDVLEIILRENKPVYYANEGEVFRILNEAVVNGGISENQIRHKQNIQDMLGKHRIFE